MITVNAVSVPVFWNRIVYVNAFPLATWLAYIFPPPFSFLSFGSIEPVTIRVAVSLLSPGVTSPAMGSTNTITFTLSPLFRFGGGSALSRKLIDPLANGANVPIFHFKVSAETEVYSGVAETKAIFQGFRRLTITLLIGSVPSFT